MKQITHSSTSSAERAMLRHFLAALAYRTQKALRGAPPDFAGFSPGSQVRSPTELIRHMASVLGYARTFFRGGSYWPEPLPTFAEEVGRFHEMLADLSHHLQAGDPLNGISEEQLLQGPFSDAMTHAGQLALLRRLHGTPVPPENFVVADIHASRLGEDQAAPRAPDAEWPEAPVHAVRRSAEMLHADLSLARRLERTEATANAAFVAAHARLDPASGADHIQVAGVYAMFDGAESPLTQTFGLGIFDPIGPAELDVIERFFAERGAPVHHETAPFLAPELVSLLTARGYQPVEMSSVLTRPTTGSFTAPPGPIVREISEDETELWARIAGQGWSSESAELAGFVEALGHAIARADGAHCFLAEEHGRPMATAAMVLNGSVALLAGASTIPSARRRGAQRALLEHRLRFAADRGADLAMIVTAPGSASQRNAERQGFRVAYTRTKWKLVR